MNESNYEELISFQSSRKATVEASGYDDFDIYQSDEIAGEMACLIENAQSSVYFCSYKFHGDSTGGKKIIDSIRSLREKSKQSELPITVNILLNSRGALAEKLYRPNDPIGLEDLNDPERYPNFKLNIQLHKADKLDSYHAKQLIIDPDVPDCGKVVFSSGDIQDLGERVQYETAVMVKSDDLAQIAMRDFSEASGKETVSQSNPQQLNKGQKEALYLSSVATNSPMSSASWPPYKKALIDSINMAKESVNILTPNLNDKDIIQALSDAVARGVNINIVLGKHHNDRVERYFGGTNQTNIDLLYSQISPENYKYFHIKWAVNPETGSIVEHGHSHTLHSKFCMVDNSVLLMGSSPLDLQAMRCSREIDTLLHVSSDKAQDVLKKVFQPHFYRGRDYKIEKMLDKIKKNPRNLSKLEIQELEIQLSSPNLSEREALGIIAAKSPAHIDHLKFDNHYLHIAKVIGKGMKGKVYLAYDEEGNKHTVKFQYNKQIAEKEARFISKYCGINSEVIKRDGGYYINMPFYPGKPLSSMISNDELTTYEKLMVVEKLKIELSELHARGILHRDLKPNNIMVNKVNGQIDVKIIDLGRSLDLSSQNLYYNTNKLKLFFINRIAPEYICDSGKIGTHSDVFAYGHIFKKLFPDNIEIYEGLIAEDGERRNETFENITKTFKRQFNDRKNAIIALCDQYPEDDQIQQLKQILSNSSYDNKNSLLEVQQALNKICDDKTNNKINLITLKVYELLEFLGVVTPAIVMKIKMQKIVSDYSDISAGTDIKLVPSKK